MFESKHFVFPSVSFIAVAESESHERAVVDPDKYKFSLLCQPGDPTFAPRCLIRNPPPTFPSNLRR